MNMHSIKRSLALVMVLTAVATLQAAIPAGYYSNAIGKKESELKTALSTIIYNHDRVSSYSALPSYFEITDLYPQSNRWWDMYSDIPLYLPWNGQKLNREHSLPKSWWGGDQSTAAYTDLNHLYPGEAKANQEKSNYPLGVVTGNPKFSNGISKVGRGVNSGGAAYVFEPADEYKGDFARTYFYMVTCYQNMNWVTTWQVRNGTYPSLQQWAIDLLLEWHRGDPVSEKEQLRNEAVYGIQHNRNPFIDYPELAELIWGNRMGENFQPQGGTTTGTPTLIAPTKGMTLDFGPVAIGRSATMQLLVKGTDLTGSDLRLRLFGRQFTVLGATQNSQGMSTIDVSRTAATTPSGTYITITFTPDAEGEISANCTLSGGNLKVEVPFTVRGEGRPMPVLTAPEATEATDITADSYTANWTSPAGETVDYWVVTRKLYRSGQPVETRTELAETNSLLIADFDADYETYSVHSMYLDCASPESNEITVRRPAAIDGIESDVAPFTVESYPGLLRVRCSGTYTGLTVFDMSGRTALRIDGEITDGTEFSLPAGVYLVVADGMRRPVKAIAR